MPVKKKQHYVPKLHLRYFSNDPEKKTINAFLPESKKYLKNIPLKDQGQEDYFYGKGIDAENFLGIIEDVAAPILELINVEKKLPKHGTDPSFSLFYFTGIMSFRTKSAVDSLNEIINKSIQQFANYDDRLKSAKDQNIVFHHKEPALFNIALTSEIIPNAYDLNAKLLLNKTKVKFIASDNPVLMYNQYLEQKKHPYGHSGLLAKGLEIFFPISPEIMVVYYDDWAYKFGNKKEDVVQITEPGDITQLNLLQIINCNKIVFCSNGTPEPYMLKLTNKAKKHMGNDKICMNKINEFIDNEGNTHVQFHQFGIEPKINLNLSFVKILKKAKKHKLSNFVVQLRNESLRGSFEKA
ncbi:DUF4238 domain-containing protein [Flammeovirgaceae bacterium SG7u.111]|nr:DUF4238 domain-containing protein [Flammeovirgaceae bacterium SG7u.132]WPO33368.1 DUF4238 domain-containing protein [Flammeovirgaceae bacterium SG7u.111]